MTKQKYSKKKIEQIIIHMLLGLVMGIFGAVVTPMIVVGIWNDVSVQVMLGSSIISAIIIFLLFTVQGFNKDVEAEKAHEEIAEYTDSVWDAIAGETQKKYSWNQINNILNFDLEFQGENDALLGSNKLKTLNNQRELYIRNKYFDKYNREISSGDLRKILEKFEYQLNIIKSK
jgi:hypothetical protein